MSSTPEPTEPVADARPEVDRSGASEPVEEIDADSSEQSRVEVEAVEVEPGVLDALLVGLVEESVDTEVEAEDAVVIDPDPALLEAHELALAALREITAEASIGEAADYRVEPDGVVSLRFANRLPGYPGWFWTVSVARVEGAEPTVLEVELLPGDGALLAPDWVPWAVRLAEYHAAQAAIAEAAHADDEDAELDEDDDSADDLDDVDDLDAADFDEDSSPILHAGDLDGVDIDVLDTSADDDDSDEDDSDEDDSDEDDDDDEDDDER